MRCPYCGTETSRVTACEACEKESEGQRSHTVPSLDVQRSLTQALGKTLKFDKHD